MLFFHKSGDSSPQRRVQQLQSQPQQQFRHQTFKGNNNNNTMSQGIGGQSTFDSMLRLKQPEFAVPAVTNHLDADSSSLEISRGFILDEVEKQTTTEVDLKSGSWYLQNQSQNHNSRKNWTTGSTATAFFLNDNNAINNNAHHIITNNNNNNTNNSIVKHTPDSEFPSLANLTFTHRSISANDAKQQQHQHLDSMQLLRNNSNHNGLLPLSKKQQQSRYQASGIQQSSLTEIDISNLNSRKNSNRNNRTNTTTTPVGAGVTTNIGMGQQGEKSAFGKHFSTRVKAQLSLFQKRLVDVAIGVVFLMKLKSVLFLGKSRIPSANAQSSVDFLSNAINFQRDRLLNVHFINSSMKQRYNNQYNNNTSSSNNSSHSNKNNSTTSNNFSSHNFLKNPNSIPASSTAINSGDSRSQSNSSTHKENHSHQSRRNTSFNIEQMVIVNEMGKVKQRITQKVNSICQAMPVIHPNSKKLFFWDLTNFIFILLNLTYVPVETVITQSFTDIYGKKWGYFLCVSIMVYLFSMVLSMNLGYYDKGHCIMDRGMIRRSYFRLGFWIDVLSTFPMIISVTNGNGLIKILNLLVVLKIQWIDKFFTKYFEITTLQRRIYRTTCLKFLYILLKVFFLVHVFACIFLALSFNLSVEFTWVTKYGNTLPEHGWFTKYVYAFYWGVTTMTTVGLGDLLPANIYEVSVLCLFMFVACGTFAYLFNAIGVILGELNQKKDEFSEEMRVVSRYLHSKNVDGELQVEIRKYMEYSFEFSNELSLDDETRVLAKLPSSIKEKLMLSSNMSILRNSAFLTQNFSDQFITRLCLSMTQESKLHADLIYSTGTIHAHQDTQVAALATTTATTNMTHKSTSIINNLSNNPAANYNIADDIKFYAIESGQVLLSASDSIEIATLERKDMFGVLEFFSDEPRQVTASSVGSTKLLSIKRRKFIEILKEFPRDFERFCMLRDLAKTSRDLSKLHLLCSCCSKRSHTISMCPQLHYVPNKESTILRNGFSIDAVRSRYDRRSRMKINAKFEQRVISDEAIGFIRDFIEDESNNNNNNYSLIENQLERTVLVADCYDDEYLQVFTPKVKDEIHMNLPTSYQRIILDTNNNNNPMLASAKSQSTQEINYPLHSSSNNNINSNHHFASNTYNPLSMGYVQHTNAHHNTYCNNPNILLKPQTSISAIEIESPLEKGPLGHHPTNVKRRANRLNSISIRGLHGYPSSYQQQQQFPSSGSQGVLINLNPIPLLNVSDNLYQPDNHPPTNRHFRGWHNNNNNNSNALGVGGAGRFSDVMASAQIESQHQHPSNNNNNNNNNNNSNAIVPAIRSRDGNHRNHTSIRPVFVEPATETFERKKDYQVYFVAGNSETVIAGYEFIRSIWSKEFPTESQSTTHISRSQKIISMKKKQYFLFPRQKFKLTRKAAAIAQACSLYELPSKVEVFEESHSPVVNLTFMNSHHH